MRLRLLSLQWFRGAADQVDLDTGNKNVVVYGPNGAGKTSFVDAIEYLIRNGKIDHLSHEYSRQHPSIFNTHAPQGAKRQVTLKLDSGKDVIANPAANGTANITGAYVIAGWEQGRTVLRQDEVSEFIRSSKGDKYSVLLPLIGLGPMENVATNLRALGRKVGEEAKLDFQKGQLQTAQSRWDEAFPGMDRAAVGALMKELHAKYVPGEPLPKDLVETLKAIHPVISKRVAGLTAEHARHLHLKSIDDADVPTRLAAVATANEKAAAIAEPLLEERLEVLRAADVYGEKLEDDAEIQCPACGQDVSASDFIAHVAAESKRLVEALAVFETRRSEFGRLADSLAAVQAALKKPEMEGWPGEPDQARLVAALQTLLRVSIDRVREGLQPHEMAELADALSIVVAYVAECVKQAPPEVAELVKDLKAVEAAGSAGTMRTLRNRIAATEGLMAFLAECERQVRDEIKTQTEAVIASISADMQRMWAILHPNEPIDQVRLYQANDAEKAIDIALRFYGKEQPSPRLTLSEGHRNSLGLCVFFALAKKNGGKFPLVLDDIVTSFDREHRAFVADLLTKEFQDTQIVLFTHDHDWFVELKRLLPGGQWRCKALLPWDNPTVGIQWDVTAFGFGAARSLLPTDAMSAANKARAIMDLEMAVICQTLEVPVPFIRGVRNDMRGAVELMERFRGRAASCLKKKDAAGNFAPWPDPIALSQEAANLLVAYGNPGSHGRYLTKPEAERLIDTCENSLKALDCATCKTPLWHASDANQTYFRCNCDSVRWKLKS